MIGCGHLIVSASGSTLLPFEFIIDGPPVSQQTRRRSRLRAWVEQVRQEAQRSWPEGELPATGPVMVRLTYLYRGAAVDLDNLAKPILDALKDLAYLDDEQVTDIHIRRRNADSVRVDNPSPVLQTGLALSGEFLHIVVEDAPDQGVLD
jgi:crossover junction endodeoxyribonuclease RusA